MLFCSHSTWKFFKIRSKFRKQFLKTLLKLANLLSQSVCGLASQIQINTIFFNFIVIRKISGICVLTKDWKQLEMRNRTALRDMSHSRQRQFKSPSLSTLGRGFMKKREQGGAAVRKVISHTQKFSVSIFSANQFLLYFIPRGCFNTSNKKKHPRCYS